MNQLEIEHERKVLMNMAQAIDMLYECSDSSILDVGLNEELDRIHDRLVEIQSIHFDKLKAEELKIYIANKYPTFTVDKLK